MSMKLAFSITRKDLDIQTFKAGGKGGQHQNKTDSGVRIVHRESGAIGESRTERSQYQNKRNALKRLTGHPKFKLWMNRKLFNLDKIERDINDKVDTWMSEEFIKLEHWDGKKWREITYPK